MSWKYLSEWILSWRKQHPQVTLRWSVVLLSAWLGAFSHVLIDGLIYPDMDLFWPFAMGNPLRIGFSSQGMILFCVISGGLGALVWGVRAIVHRR